MRKRRENGLNDWKRIQWPIKHIPPCIDPLRDECYYIREYCPGKGFLYSETNQLVKNYKHDVKTRHDLEVHKTSSINKFAEELSLFFDDSKVYYLSFIPSSKNRSDKRYDDRLEKTLFKLKELRSKIVIENPVSIKFSMRASHKGGPRLINDLFENYGWDGLKNNEIGNLYIIDDIITTGSHYKAFKNFIMKHRPGIEIIGLFWANCTDNYFINNSATLSSPIRP
jgi:predicted amidophosphoribosyltransferase